MWKTKPRGRYQSVSLPVPFVQEIKKHIVKDSKYKSIAEFVKAAVREKIDKEKYPFYRNLSKALLMETSDKRTLKEEEEYTKRLELEARQIDALVKAGKLPSRSTSLQRVIKQQSDDERLTKLEKKVDRIHHILEKIKQ